MTGSAFSLYMYILKKSHCKIITHVSAIPLLPIICAFINRGHKVSYHTVNGWTNYKNNIWSRCTVKSLRQTTLNVDYLSLLLRFEPVVSWQFIYFLWLMENELAGNFLLGQRLRETYLHHILKICLIIPTYYFCVVIFISLNTICQPDADHEHYSRHSQSPTQTQNSKEKEKHQSMGIGNSRLSISWSRC